MASGAVTVSLEDLKNGRRNLHVDQMTPLNMP